MQRGDFVAEQLFGLLQVIGAVQGLGRVPPREASGRAGRSFLVQFCKATRGGDGAAVSAENVKDEDGCFPWEDDV